MSMTCVCQLFSRFATKAVVFETTSFRQIHCLALQNYQDLWTLFTTLAKDYFLTLSLDDQKVVEQESLYGRSLRQVWDT